jgi:cytochrome P450
MAISYGYPASSDQIARYVPPGPKPLSPLTALARTVWRGEGDLLSLLPADAYTMPVGPLGFSRRTILIVNDPALTGPILADPDGIFPKNDLMVGALAPLVGDSMFVSSGETWRRQRAMIDPAFSHIRLAKAFTAMTLAIDAFEVRLDAFAASNAPFSLDLAMSQLTADIICRTVFSTSLDHDIARDVFEAFAVFERSVAHVELKRLIFDKPFAPIPQRAEVLAACTAIRRHLATLLDRRVEQGTAFDDIASAAMGARDAGSGAPFSREELIDQLGVFFLAGHETTASALTWAFFIAAEQPSVADRIRTEVEAVAGEGPVGFEPLKRLGYARAVFKETLRLYPPITFIPRVAARATQIGPYAVKRGAMIMIAPWAIHRHATLWPDPHAFDPDRFSPGRDSEIPAGAYLPFGIGPRVCVGAAFAQTEAALILARLLRRYRFTVDAPDRVRPVARLTTRPAEEVIVRVARRLS